MKNFNAKPQINTDNLTQQSKAFEASPKLISASFDPDTGMLIKAYSGSAKPSRRLVVTIESVRA